MQCDSCPGYAGNSARAVTAAACWGAAFEAQVASYVCSNAEVDKTKEGDGSSRALVQVTLHPCGDNEASAESLASRWSFSCVHHRVAFALRGFLKPAI